MSLRWRRGGLGIAPPPGGGAVYGPTDGAAAIRAGAGARAVVNPGGGISFNSSSSLQAAINAGGSGTTFVCTSNAPLWNTAVNTGTKAPTIIFPGGVGQIVIQGNGAQFIPIDLGIGSTLRGGTWQNFGSAATVHGIQVSGENCVVEDAVVTQMWNSGIKVNGTGARISHCTSHANRQSGYSGNGDNWILEYCDIYGNNTNLNNPGVSAGAGKILFGGHGHYHHNYIHDNLGFGMWWDTDAFDWLIEENVAEDNSFAGFFYEANYGSVIRRNLIANNGRNVAIVEPATIQNTVNARLSDNAAARQAPDSQIYPVDFHNNIVDDDQTHGGNTGRIIMLWDHSDNSARHVANHDIHHNQFWIRTTGTNRIRNHDQDATPPGSVFTTNYQIWDLNNIFRSNEYRVASLSPKYWTWDTGTGTGVEKTWAEWLTFHPNDGPRSLI